MNTIGGYFFAIAFFNFFVTIVLLKERLTDDKIILLKSPLVVRK